MLLLLFTIGDERYGIEAVRVIEVWPLLPLKPIHRTPDYIAGIANCRKQLVPVIDISKLYINRAVFNRISTRIILIKVKGAHGDEHLVGLMAECVTDTVNVDCSSIASISVKSEEGGVIGEELLINDQLIQKINVDELLSTELYSQIFCHDN